MRGHITVAADTVVQYNAIISSIIVSWGVMVQYRYSTGTADSVGILEL